MLLTVPSSTLSADFTPPWSPEGDTQMESEEVFLGEPSTSAATLQSTAPLISDISPPSVWDGPGKRKRPLNLVSSHQSCEAYYGNTSGRAKRRLLCRQGDIDERTLLRVADAVGPKYTELGIQLGLHYKQIQSNVENKASMNKDNLKALWVLHEWKSRSGEDFCYAELAKALEADEIGLHRVAVQVCYNTS